MDKQYFNNINSEFYVEDTDARDTIQKIENEISSGGYIKTGINKSYRTVGGVVQYNSTTNSYELINDNGHEPIGLTNITLIEGGKYMNIYYEKPFSKICSSNISISQKPNDYGLSIGASVGLNYIQLKPKISQNYNGYITLSGNNTSSTINNYPLTISLVPNNNYQYEITIPYMSHYYCGCNFQVFGPNQLTYNVVVAEITNTGVRFMIVDSSGNPVIRTSNNLSFLYSLTYNEISPTFNNQLAHESNFWVNVVGLE